MAAAEAALTAYDIYTTAETLSDPNASTTEKALAGGGFVVGLVTPGGGYSKVAKEAGKLLSKTDDAVDAVKTGNQVLRGARNPKVADALKRGLKAHAEREYPEGFIKEKVLPSGKRMDAYNPETKQINELKPNNRRAIKRGEKQVREYCKECDNEYGPGHTGNVETYD